MLFARDLLERSRMFDARADRAADPVSRQHYREMAAHYRSVAMEHRDVAPSLVPERPQDRPVTATEDA